MTSRLDNCRSKLGYRNDLFLDCFKSLIANFYILSLASLIVANLINLKFYMDIFACNCTFS